MKSKSASRVCVAICLWFLLISCILADCPMPKKKFPGGRIFYQKSSDRNLKVAPERYILRFRCNPGYILIGARSILCLSSEWTKGVPACTEMKCADPPSITSGQYTLERVQSDFPHIGSVAVYSCDDKYELENETESTLICSLDAENNSLFWRGQTPQCRKKVSCAEPKLSPNGEWSGDCCFSGNVIEYSCEDGYDLVGEEELECLPSGNWTSKRPYCRPPDEYCEHPPAVKHGVVIGQKEGDYYRWYDEVEIVCEPGFAYPVEGRYLLCDEDGWEAEFLDCTESFCDLPKPLANGTIPEVESTNTTQYPYNFEITYICDEGYRLIGDSWSYCKGKEWSGKTPYCEVITCPDPGSPEYGTRRGDRFGIGNKVTFKCFTGFHLLGAFERYCQPNGQWSGELAKCNTEKNYCPNPGIPINGAKNSSNYDLGEKIGFQCQPGYTLWGSKVRECLSDGTWSGKEAMCKGPYDFDNTAYITNILNDEIGKKAAEQERQLREYYAIVAAYEGRALPESTSTRRLVLYFVFDVSGSIGEKNFRKSVDFAKALVQRVGISKKGARAGAVTFSSEATIQFLPAQYSTTEEVTDALDRLVFTGGGTSTTDALEKVREDCITNSYQQLKDKQQTSVIFIMTDGRANMGGNPAKEAEILKREVQAEIYCIGITTDFLGDTLYEIASDPKEEHVFILQNFQLFGYLVQQIANGSIDYSECGLGMERLKHLNLGRVIGGGQAPEPWPWMAAIYFKHPKSRNPDDAELKCGGTIIDEKYILTASHCLFVNGTRRKEADIIIKLGLTNVNNQSYVQKFEVKKIFTHAMYPRNSKIYDYDIALLQLSRPIEFNAFVRPICLPPEVLEPDSALYKGGEHVVATGWGHDGIVHKFDLKADLQTVDHLKEVIMPIQPKDRCKKTAENNDVLHAFTERMFCAGDGLEGNDTCQGDSGGPLMQSQINDAGQVYWTQIGIVSWGIGCGLAGTYGYYTHVQALRPWITNTIKVAEISVEER